MTINDDFTREMLFTPADAEAERLAVAEHESRYTAEGRDGFAFGFAAGLAHARAWRALTDAPETWPEEGQAVVLREDFYPVDCDMNRCGPLEARYCSGAFTRECAEFWSWWAPLPAPPEQEKDG